MPALCAPCCSSISESEVGEVREGENVIDGTETKKQKRRPDDKRAAIIGTLPCDRLGYWGACMMPVTWYVLARRREHSVSDHGVTMVVIML